MKKSSGFNQDISPLTELLVIYAGLMTLGALPIYAAYVQERVDTWIVACVFDLVAFPYWTISVWEKIRSPRAINCVTEYLQLNMPSNSIVKIPYQEIISISRTILNGNAIRISFMDNFKENVFFINGVLLKDSNNSEHAVGNLIEDLCVRSSQLVKFDIDKLIDDFANAKGIWGKTPDWAIINTAKRRAEENRKKLTPNPLSQTERGDRPKVS